MDYNSDFRHDLEVGQVSEKALAEIFENKKVEVKRDLMARKLATSSSSLNHEASLRVSQQASPSTTHSTSESYL
jgi:hypothetical protein